MTRQEANKKLLKELEWFIDSCPDQRFGQILCNYFFPKYQTTDPFFVEPTDTLAEVDRAKKCAILDTIAPIGVLSEEELAHAKTLSTLEAVKYIKSIVPSFDLKLSKLYYDLYIGKDNKETEDYVSFETAKLLKAKGFKGDINAYYHIWDNGTRVCSVQEFSRSEAPHLYIPAPTLQMAMKWLREVHGLFIRITEDMTGNVFEWSVYQKNYGCRASTYVEDSYEQACEMAIKYCLEKLI